jgi:N-methylhydantoinase A
VLPVAPDKVEAIYAAMERDGTQRLDQADVPLRQQRFERWVEARYRRQVHHVRVAAPALIDEAGLTAMAASFEHEYERLFGRGAALKDAGIELVNYGVDAIGVVPHVAPDRAHAGRATTPHAQRMTWCPTQVKMVETPVYDGPSLATGTEFPGPAIIEHPGTNIVVLAGQTARIDDDRHTHIMIGNARVTT